MTARRRGACRERAFDWVAVAAYDIHRHRVPNLAVYPAIGIALVVAFLRPDRPWWDFVLAGMAAAALFVAIDHPAASSGVPTEIQPALRALLGSQHGMVVVAGPTGSGKTTTLYAAINELDGVSLNVTTIEDPVEYTFERVNQTQVNTAAGLTFASGLRAIPHQDPDVILVGTSGTARRPRSRPRPR